MWPHIPELGRFELSLEPTPHGRLVSASDAKRDRPDSIKAAAGVPLKTRHIQL